MALAGTPIHGGELAGSLSDSAYTLPAGEKRLQIIAPSSMGVTDNLELSTILLGWFAGPNLATEVGLSSGQASALSIKPYSAWHWNGGFTAGAEVLYTIGGVDTNRLTIASGAGHDSLSEDHGLTTSIRAGYDLVVREDRLLQLSVQADPYASIHDRAFNGRVGAGYTWAWDTYRLQLGVASASGSSLDAALETAGQQVEIPAYVLMPYLLMWWRF